MNRSRSILLIILLSILIVSCSAVSEKYGRNPNISFQEAVDTAVAATQTAMAPKVAAPKRKVPTAVVLPTRVMLPTPTEKFNVTIDEQVLMDKNGIKITAKSLDMDSSSYGPFLKLEILNNDGSDYIVQTRLESVNGYMAETIFSADVPVSYFNSVSDEIIFTKSSLEKPKIEIIKNLSFRFHVIKNVNWDDSFDSDQITINTKGSERYTQPDDYSGKVLVDRVGIKIIARGIETTDTDTNLVVFIENKTDRDLIIMTGNESVNGIEIYPDFFPRLPQGKKQSIPFRLKLRT